MLYKYLYSDESRLLDGNNIFKIYVHRRGKYIAQIYTNRIRAMYTHIGGIHLFLARIARARATTDFHATAATAYTRQTRVFFSCI